MGLHLQSFALAKFPCSFIGMAKGTSFMNTLSSDNCDINLKAVFQKYSPKFLYYSYSLT